MIIFDVAHVFRVFGGPRKLLDAMDRYQPGHGLNYNQVQMWTRRQIPAKHIAVILYCIDKAGHNILEFLTDDEFIAPLSPPGNSGDKTKRRRNARPRG